MAAYVWQPDLPVTLSPRPYLHPVRTLAGATVTQAQPVDHPHHLGVSVAVSDLGGTNFWGGRTFVTGTGSTWLDNHGSQLHAGFSRLDDTGFTEELHWQPTGAPTVATEQRTVEARRLDPTAWALDLTFTLTNQTDAPLQIHSSATKGRPGAGYGGYFWRAPHTATDWQIFTADADGEAAVHGSAAPWLALSGSGPEPWTLVFVQVGVVDPWFVRVAEYPGVGPALAWSEPLTLTDSLTRRVVTVVADGRADRDTIGAWVRQIA